VRFRSTEDFPQLAQRPGRARIGRDVGVKESTYCMFDFNEDIGHLESRCHRYEEVDESIKVLGL
jgi:hypothetical protein